MKILGIVSAAALIAGSAMSPALAQTEDADRPSTTHPTGVPEASWDQTAQLSVYDADGNVLGSVDEITIEADGAEYAIVSVGEHLGLGAKKIRVPLSELTLRDDGAGYSTQMTLEQIEATPAYEPEGE
jgi:hypothetical protein